MTCEKWREALSARLDGEDDPAQRDRIDAHLAGCAACRTWYQHAELVTRRARLTVAEPVPDLTQDVLAAVSAQPTPRRPRTVTVLRGALGVLGAAQILLAAAQVATLTSAPHSGHGAMGATSMDHLWHESASWNAAVGAGLLWVAARRQRTAGVLPILSAFVAVLTLLSAADVAAGRVQWPRLASHAVVVLAVAVAALINRVDRQPRTPRGEGSRWQLSPDNQPPPQQTWLRLLPRDGTAQHAVRNRLGVPSWRPPMVGRELIATAGRLQRIRGVAASRAASRRVRTIVVRGWTRTGVLAGGAVAALLLTTGPASAHVEVSADKAKAGATDSVLTFVAESESTTAGITALRVVLPAGIKPADVTWVSGPTGWALKTAADGYTVSGPAVPVGKDAEYAVRVRQLPTDTRQLVFKTLQTYSDGHVDRWIEEPNPGGAEPENPAPVLTVAAAPAAAATSPSATPTPSASAPATDASSAAAPAPAAQNEQDGGSRAWVWLLVVAAAAAALGGLWWAVRRRRA